MKITHGNDFRPVTIVIETRAEAEDLKNTLGKSPSFNTATRASVNMYSALARALNEGED